MGIELHTMTICLVGCEKETRLQNLISCECPHQSSSPSPSSSSTRWVEPCRLLASRARIDAFAGPADV